jgi:hypothetical protein
MEEESGVRLISETAESFFSNIRSGNWEGALECSHSLIFPSISHSEIVNMLMELRYVEFIESGLTIAALEYLRNGICQHTTDYSRLYSDRALLFSIFSFSSL